MRTYLDDCGSASGLSRRSTDCCLIGLALGLAEIAGFGGVWRAVVRRRSDGAWLAGVARVWLECFGSRRAQ